MTDRPINWQALNAYVDGELDAREAARVAQAAGEDAEVAEQISLLYHLKGCAHDSMPAAPSDLSSLLPPRRKKRSRTVAFAILAACMACLVAAWAILEREELPSPLSHDQFLATARVLHAGWLRSERQNTNDPPPVVLAALTRFGRLPVVPDLESTGLSVGLVSLEDGPAGKLLQIGYRGVHGCHLSLFVFDESGKPSDTVDRRGGPELAHGWSAGDLGYLLFAKGMDPGRFDLIATTVEKATRLNRPLDERARQLLAENRRIAKSCHA